MTSDNEMNNQVAQAPTPAERGLPELNVSWSDHFARQGDMAMSHNYAAFKAAESWILANMPALSRPLPSDWVAVPRDEQTEQYRTENPPQPSASVRDLLALADEIDRQARECPTVDWRPNAHENARNLRSIARALTTAAGAK